MAKSRSTPVSYLKTKNFWKKNSNTVWLASSLMIKRNFERFNFPGKLDTDKQKEIIKLVFDGVKKNKLIKTPSFFRAEELDPINKEFLAEHFLSTSGFYQAHAGEGFILDKTGLFLGILNVDDHLQLELVDTNGEIEKHWNELVSIESEFGMLMKYAFSQKFGFLTADPTFCGTGMQVSFFLQLSGLIHTEKIDEILSEKLEDQVSVAGLQGNPTEIVGDVIAIKNNYCLGVNEEKVLSVLEAFAAKLIVEENTVRKHLKESKNVEVMDRVSRAYGILAHSYQIEATEALNALSLLKLGVDCNWVSGIDMAEVNRLFFNCRRAHMISKIGEEIEQEQLAHKRAELIHKSLKNVTLVM